MFIKIDQKNCYTLEPPFSGHCRPEDTHIWVFARITEIQWQVCVESINSRFIHKSKIGLLTGCGF